MFRLLAKTVAYFSLAMAGMKLEMATAMAQDVPPPASSQGNEGLASTDNRDPVPDAAAVRKASETAREIFQEDFAQARTSEAKSALAEKLLKQSQDSQGALAERYALLCEARDLAVDAGDTRLVEKAVTSLDRYYRVQRLEMLADIYQELMSKPRLPAANKKLVERALALAEEAGDEEQLACAQEFVKTAAALAAKTRDPGLMKQAKTRSDEIVLLERESGQAAQAQERLKSDPADPKANLALGRYLCLRKKQWQAGLKHLLLGSNPTLKVLAEQSLAAPEDVSLQVSLGDQWYDAAEAAKDDDKALLLAGARFWYAKAAPNLTGLAKAKIDVRLAEKTPVAPKANLPVPPRGAKAFGGHLYKPFFEQVSWTDAKAKCEEMGGHLVCIGSPQENFFVIALIESIIGPGTLGTDDKKYWLGGRVEDGKWTWVNGEPFQYSPNPIAVDVQKPCLRHAGKNWLTHKDAIGLVTGYVCEWEQLPGKRQAGK
jgi:hypothetical protein